MEKQPDRSLLTSGFSLKRQGSFQPTSRLRLLTCVLLPLVAQNPSDRYGRRAEHHGVFRVAASLRRAALYDDENKLAILGSSTVKAPPFRPADCSTQQRY